MIDDKLHDETLYRISDLTDIVMREHKELKGYYSEGFDVKGWDSYNAKPIKRGTIDTAQIVLNKIHVFFLENIGFLNNRSFEIETCPLSDGNISITINYAGELECYFSIKNNDDIHCCACLKYFFVFDGQTIAERNSKMFHPKENLTGDTNISGVKGFLNEAFYQHKWNTYED